MTLLLVVVVAGVYAGALPLYLLFRVSRPALALGAASEALTAVNVAVTQRDSALRRTLRIVRALARGASRAPDSLALARRLLVMARVPLSVPPDAPFPRSLQTELARIDRDFTELGGALAGIVDALARGRARDVAARLGAIDQLVETA